MNQMSQTKLTLLESGDVAQTKTPATEAPTTGAPTTTTTTTTNDSAIGTENKTQSKGPTADQPSTTGDTGFKAAQADIRDPESNPTTDPKKEAERKNVDDTGALDASENPGKVDGAGPRPVEEVARDHGGDAGAVAGAGAGQSASNEGGEKLGSSGEEDKGESKGTGEEYIKSSGLKADGGDFDATKPGAGREADRELTPHHRHPMNYIASATIADLTFYRFARGERSRQPCSCRGCWRQEGRRGG